MTELFYKKEVFEIIGAAIEIHKVLGPGFLEAVYQEALAIEFGLRNIPFAEQPRQKIGYKGHRLKSCYVPDYICYDEIIVEIKAIKRCSEIEEAQIINALKATKKKVEILINFGEPSLYWKRYVY
ncbi:MAG: GxxExxY protein [Candidatus Marinimicrobia bacterium]|nr:GxxExxY protein [Candidatus Neomarinimicrobiota bacterium]MBL7067121.1 GxxExxY protein [Candidatus Neomarinimicrobiota bacterium]